MPSGLGYFPLWQQQHATPADGHPACSAAKPRAGPAAQSSAAAAFGFGPCFETPRNLLSQAEFPMQLGQLAWQQPAAKHKCLVNVWCHRGDCQNQGLPMQPRQLAWQQPAAKHKHLVHVL